MTLETKWDYFILFYSFLKNKKKNLWAPLLSPSPRFPCNQTELSSICKQSAMTEKCINGCHMGEWIIGIKDKKIIDK